MRSETSMGLCPTQSSLFEFTTGDSLDVASNREKMDEIVGRLDLADKRLEAVEIELGIRPKTKGRQAELREYIKAHKGTIIPLVALILIIPGWFVSGWFKYYLDHKDDAFNSAIDSRIAAKVLPLNTKLQEFDVKLARIEVKLDDLLIQRFATQPTNSQSAIQAAQVLKNARSSGEKLDAELIVDAGKQFINAKEVLHAWDAALAFIDYKSFLNSFAPTVTTLQGQPRTVTTHYGIQYVGEHSPKVSTIGIAPIEQAARFNLIGRNFNANQVEGNEFIIVEGGEPILDNMELKNVVFTSGQIVYRGGPLVMDNVVFVNCTFQIVQEANGQKVSTAILTGNPNANIKLS
jgi:hypothetical protein